MLQSRTVSEKTVRCAPGELVKKPTGGLFDLRMVVGDHLRITRTFHFKEPHSLQAIAEVFNLVNITKIRGTTNRNYSGFSNTIDSAGFNRPLETAGKFFGARRATGVSVCIVVYVLALGKD